MPNPDDQYTETELLESIRHLGIEVPNSEVAESLLRHTGRYRLQPYWLPLTNCIGKYGKYSTDHKFSFDDIVSLYTFDRLLRLHILDAIERIEVSIRASLGRHMTRTYGPQGYIEKSLYNRTDFLEENIAELKSAFRRSSDASFKEYGIGSKAYEEPLPEIWKSVEFMTFGLLSKWIANLRLGRDRMSVADTYGMDEKLFCSVLRHLTLVRNICAHHDRIWNLRLRIKMKLPIATENLRLSVQDTNDSRIYNTLVVISHLIQIIVPETEWQKKLDTLIEQHPIVDLSEMGFPLDWRDRPIWNLDDATTPPIENTLPSGLAQIDN